MHIASLFTKNISSTGTDREDLNEIWFSIPTVLLAVGVPLSIGIAFSGGDDLTVPLRIAGSYGSPLLYGALPVAMAWNQRRKLDNVREMIPGGQVSLVGIALLTTIYFSEDLLKDHPEAMRRWSRC